MNISICLGGGSVVWNLSQPLMNSFNKTEAAVYPMLCILKTFSEINLMTILMYFPKITNKLIIKAAVIFITVNGKYVKRNNAV